MKDTEYRINRSDIRLVTAYSWCGVWSVDCGVWSALVELNVYSQGCSVSLGRGDPEVEKILWTADQKKVLQ